MRRQTQDTETYWCYGFQPIHRREVCRSEDDTTSTNFSSSRPTSSILNLFRAACRPVTESGEVLDRRDPDRFRFIGCCPAPIPPVTISDTRPVSYIVNSHSSTLPPCPSPAPNKHPLASLLKREHWPREFFVSYIYIADSRVSNDRLIVPPVSSPSLQVTFFNLSFPFSFLYIPCSRSSQPFSLHSLPPALSGLLRPCAFNAEREF